MNLPETTTDRLLAVADIIDLTPERWDQETWVTSEGEATRFNDAPRFFAGRGPVCETRACVAGWAVALTPCDELVDDLAFDWDGAGAYALGLDELLAEELFRGGLPMGHGQVADTLRRLAKLPEGQRDGEHARDVLGDDLADRLFGNIPDVDDE